MKKQRKADAIPSVFPWNNCIKQKKDERSERRDARNLKVEEIKNEAEEPLEVLMDDADISDVANWCTVESTDSNLNQDQDASNFTELEDKEEVCLTETSSQTIPTPFLSIENFIDDHEGMLFYTGLATHTDFLFVLHSLGPAAYHLRYLYNQVQNLSVENQLFLTLIKLRQNQTNYELSRSFGISKTTVDNIWITWVNFMARQFREINFWPDRDTVNLFSPCDFFQKFPSTRVIIDGTEIPVKKPKPPVAQQSTFSTYKNRNTVKVLIGATPGGLISYISPAYGGSTSDRQIVERSPLTNICEPGDSIMSDKGFNVQDLFAPKDVKVNIPTFFKKKNRMSNKTVLRDRKISSKRVHIERLIGLAKTYKILKGPLNSTETKLASEISYVCFIMCNFRKCIVPKHA